MSFTMLSVLVLLALALVVSRFVGRLIDYWFNIYTYEHYAADHPDCITKQRVLCSKCRGSSIYVSRIGESPQALLYAHICRRCGTTLYHSRSRIGKPND